MRGDCLTLLATSRRLETKKIVELNQKNLKADEKIAREILGEKSLVIKGLAQAWNCFLSAETMAKEFYRSYDSLPWQAKIAFTKAIVVE